MNSDNNSPKNAKGKHDNIIDGIILTAISSILVLILFGAFGKAGNAVAAGLRGIFGYAIYGITFAMLTIGILRFCNYAPNARTTTIIGAILMFACVIFIFHVATSKEYLAGYGAYLKSCYTQANTAGGALFGLLAYPIAKLNYIFAIVVFSLLLVGAFVLTFLVQITKMPIFKANDIRPRDKKDSLGKLDGNWATQEIEPGLNIALIDGSVPNDKIAKVRKQTGHDAIKSFEDIGNFIQQEGGDDDIVVIKHDVSSINAKTPTRAVTNNDKLANNLAAELPPPTLAEVNSAIDILKIHDKKTTPSKPVHVGDDYTKEDATRLLYDDEIKLDKGKQKVEFNEVDRSYTNNARLDEIAKNLNQRTHGGLPTGDNHADITINNDKKNIVSYNVAPSTPSVSEQINSLFDNTDGDYYTPIDEDGDINIVPTEQTAAAPVESKDYAQKDTTIDNDPYAALNSSKPIDLTARGAEPMESFADKLQREAVEKLAKEQAEKDKTRTFKDELQRRKEELERKRKERSDKGGTHVAPNSVADYTAPTFGTGVNFGLPNAERPAVKPEPTKQEEKRAVVTQLNAPYKAPHIALLNNYIATPPESEDFSDKIDILEATFKNFGIDARVVNIVTGPTFTRLELQMPAGISVSRINTYANDIAMCLEAESVRLQTPIPGKNLFGVELPNKSRGVVGLKDLFNSPNFNNNKHAISFAAGQDCDGRQYVIDLAKTPHMLIAGATGAGKSVCINTLICSIIYKYSPSEVKLALVDPKQVELSRYNGLPHLLVEEAIYDKEKVINLLDWTIDEMEARYSLLKSKRATGIGEFNDIAIKNNEAKLPYIVVIIDEVSDIVMNFKKEFEERVVRIAQKARAAGIVLILATQRPSVDVITGIIKANLPSRIAFAVASQVDSKTIIDVGGAEKLLRNGDMLYVAGTDPRPVRIQGAFVSNEEVNAICEYVRENNQADFDEAIAEAINRTKQSEAAKNGGGDMVGMSSAEKDKMFVLCLKHIIEAGECSSSMLMRRFALGFQRAARIVDSMVELGYVYKNDNKKYEVGLSMEDFMRIYGDFDLG